MGTEIVGQELMMAQMSKLMAQMEVLQAENKSLKAGVAESTVGVTCTQNWNMHRDGDNLVIVVNLTEGGEIETKSKKSKIISLIKKPVPFKFGSEGEVHANCDWSSAYGNLTLQINQGKPDAYLKVKE